MKWWKKLLLGMLLLAGICGVATGIIFREDLQRAQMSKEDYENLLGDSLEDEDVIPYEEATNEDGFLSDEATDKLLEKMAAHESAVIVDCAGIAAPESMPVYQKKALKLPAETEILSLLEECAGDNPDSKSYRLSESPQVGFVPSQENPIEINILGEQRIQSFLYERRWYDLRAENPSELKQETAIAKAEGFLKKLFSLLGLHCEMMPSGQWKIEKSAVSTDEQALYVHQYDNPGGRDEECYDMEMSCSLDGYPLLSSINMCYQKNENSEAVFGDHFELSYGASGWVKLDCTYPWDFRKTGKNYQKLLSMKQAVKSLEKRLKVEEKANGATVFTIQDADLGYFVTDEKKLRPAWYFYGIAHDIGDSSVIYLMDAVTGRRLAKAIVS